MQNIKGNSHETNMNKPVSWKVGLLLTYFLIITKF